MDGVVVCGIPPSKKPKSRLILQRTVHERDYQDWKKDKAKDIVAEFLNMIRNSTAPKDAAEMSDAQLISLTESLEKVLCHCKIAVERF